MLKSVWRVMVVAFLRRAHLGLEAQHLRAVLAQLTVHGDVASDDLFQPLDKRVDDGGVVVEIGRLDELDVVLAHGPGVVVAGVLVARKHGRAPDRVGPDCSGNPVTEPDRVDGARGQGHHRVGRVEAADAKPHRERLLHLAKVGGWLNLLAVITV